MSKKNLHRRHGSSAWSSLLAALVLLSAGLPGAVAQPAADAGGVWPPADLARRLAEEPKGDQDKQLKELIAQYQQRLDRRGDPLVTAALPRLRANLAILHKEYNLDHNRFPGDCFNLKECLDYLNGDMKFILDALDKGQDPGQAAKGRWQGMLIWIERMNIPGRYDVILPRNYDPKASWPVILSYQDNPDDVKLRATPYLLVRSLQKGYPKGFTNVENKTRSVLKDLAGKFNIDPFRVYATGFSYGGHTDLVMAFRHPHWFAAIAPVCNDLRDQQTPYVKYLKNVPTLLLHGSGDSFLATGRTVHEYMKQADCNVRFETYPGGHDPRGNGGAGPFAKIETLTDFFDQHVMDPWTKTVSHITEHPRYSRAFWVDSKLTKAADAEGVFEVRVKDGNVIEIDAADSIAQLDLYLSDKLVDMNKPVKVSSGGKTLYEGKPAEKLTVKLREGQDYSRAGGPATGSGPSPASGGAALSLSTDGNDALWLDLLAIRKAAGFAGVVGQKTGPWKPASAPATTAPPATQTR